MRASSGELTESLTESLLQSPTESESFSNLSLNGLHLLFIRSRSSRTSAAHKSSHNLISDFASSFYFHLNWSTLQLWLKQPNVAALGFPGDF